MSHGDYGNSICAVVYEGAGHSGCQFSFTCDGELARGRDPEAWHNAEMLAARILTGEVRLHDATGGATNFHAVSVQPDWADTLTRTTQIGNHIFYRDPPRSRAS
jgi:spore germination cell wall hydrolase CwlJ-like protein